eukprot:CAMPEP_0195085398 /NCGR_PEP_ID=MMETSP0448-20130528/25828_1 /TAXON_ID=66468 /ORGANISM="Heterocapsa triquestra, Strain CCMP 448" /LENGTH=614 /DNA_ID=CAMNT_0040118797 /DNA_START=5 /DNA_END=1847 /DNA_ORIENTATION=-
MAPVPTAPTAEVMSSSLGLHKDRLRDQGRAMGELEKELYGLSDVLGSMAEHRSKLRMTLEALNMSVSKASQTLLTVRAEEGEAPQRHLVLNMDVNKTIIMSDKVGAKTFDMVVNAELAGAAWGIEEMQADGSKTWVLCCSEPSPTRPVEVLGWPDIEIDTVVSYTDWVQSQYPRSEDKKFRNNIIGSFTHDGHPGAALKGYADELTTGLRLPDDSYMLILPSFLELLATLKRNKRSFSLVFRTYGEDLECTLNDLCRFCEGNHPLFPDVRMDGSDGEPDYRVSLSEPDKFGTFHSDKKGLSLVMGTLEQPGEGKYKSVEDSSMAFYGKEFPHLPAIVGREAVQSFVWERTAQCGTIALRDYYQAWRQSGMSSEGGKVFFFGSVTDGERHCVFFDDNIRFNDFYIVNPICIEDVERKYVVGHMLMSHVCRAEPLSSIRDRQYFVQELQRLEAYYSRRIACRKRMAALMRRFLFLRQVISIPTKLPVYDPFRRERSWESAVTSDRNELCDLNDVLSDEGSPKGIHWDESGEDDEGSPKGPPWDLQVERLPRGQLQPRLHRREPVAEGGEDRSDGGEHDRTRGQSSLMPPSLIGFIPVGNPPTWQPTTLRCCLVMSC